MNKFRNKIFRDFEENLYRHLNISLSEFLLMFREHGEDPIARFDEVLKKEGPEELRLLMDVYVNGLSILYTEAELGRELSVEEGLHVAELHSERHACRRTKRSTDATRQCTKKVSFEKLDCSDNLLGSVSKLICSNDCIKQRHLITPTS